MTTFTIYTTGIADNTSMEQYNVRFDLLSLWLNITCNNITSEIPINFTEIIIKHYDILINAKRDNLNHQEVSMFLNQMIINMTYRLDHRIIKHEFNIGQLNLLELSYPHLIIDMAHIFKYGPNKTVRWIEPCQFPRINTELMPIKSIYISWNDKNFAQKKIIEITDTGYVRTFIDCLEDSGFITDDIYDPVQTLNDIIKEIKIDLMKRWRLTKKKVVPTYDGGHFDIIFDSFNMIDQLLDKLFKNKTREEILDFSTYANYEDFNSILNDQKYI
jgi:hypothetical protein